MVLPTTSAGAIFHTASSNGKFHGVIAPTTPIGVNRVIICSAPDALTVSSGNDF